MDELIFSVTELNSYVQRSLQNDPLLNRLRVRGEVSNFKRYSSGHCYFTLKDDRSRISCAWFANAQRGSDLSVMRDGAKIQALGSAGLYVRDGQYQFVVERVQAEGVGMWHQQLRFLVEKLRADGLLDPERKRPLPEFPETVGVITSAKGAAVRDIIRVASRRMPWVHILLYPVQVQGDDAPDQLVRALEYFSCTKAAQVVILGRGGGSIEDLWAFNEERVARATAACSVPVISAVGHETDVAVTDLVADARAATPSMAAEMAVPDAQALRRALQEDRQALDLCLERWLKRALEETNRRARMLALLSPQKAFEREKTALQSRKSRLQLSVHTLLQRETLRIQNCQNALRTLSPERVLDRGYVLARRTDGHVLTHVADVTVGEDLTLYVSGGRLRARVTDKFEDNHEES